eukprot:scaffold3700_cov387-Prasinococcus_capsulatus_cf.AAC.12
MGRWRAWWGCWSRGEGPSARSLLRRVAVTARCVHTSAMTALPPEGGYQLVVRRCQGHCRRSCKGTAHSATGGPAERPRSPTMPVDLSWCGHPLCQPL